jgi:hypothetical protein
VLRGWGGELLRRDNVDKRKRKKRLIRLQVHPYRCWLTGLITPVRKTCGECLQILALQTHSGTASATSSTWYILAGIITPVALYLSVFTCGEKAYIAKQKEETWIRWRLLWRLTRYGVEQN